MTRKRLGFFTRLLDHATPKSATGWPPNKFATRNAWDSTARGLLSTIFMSTKAACRRRWSFSPTRRRTERIRLGTAIITLPMENPLRVAEDAAVLDLLADGRLEVGFGSGGTPTSFLPFGLTMDQRSAVFAEHLHLIQSAWRGIRSHPDNHLYPQAPQLAERIWIATFSVEGAVRAAQAGHGLMLSRTQPRPAGQPRCRWTLSRIRLLTPISPRCRRASAADPRLADGLCRRQPAVCAAGRRTRPAPAGAQHRAAGHDIIGDTVTDFCRSLTRTLATRTSPLRWPAIASCGG
jgi:hypothetical protein